ncbi:MAG: bifunctional ADP-dependent NAD(P)H-hydrate dehydratase/NAD(P)H-hydrate epimerase, partial [Elusimicrobia bacterium]|nr:bifunctional ADP-dependent NAD(P)H-hydrate dehydratase/NAD(P)H-hydrate epimerase [Elusimicrobiota bacterium]
MTTLKSLSKSELREGLVERKDEDHKGVYGHVLIVAGSRGMSGAAVLAARAALRSGVGLVTVAVPKCAADLAAAAVASA